MKIHRSGNFRKSRSAGLVVPLFSVFLYILLVWSAARPLAGWYAIGGAGEKGLRSAARYDSRNAAYAYLLGRYYDLDVRNPDQEKALFYYRKALALAPLQPDAWVGLCRVLHRTGKDAEAEFALERAVRLNPSDAQLMWEAATFWLMGDKVDKAVQALSRFIVIEPEAQSSAYDLCWRLGLGNDYLLRNFVPRRYSYQSGYLGYLIRTKRPAEAEEVWKVIDRNRLDKDLFLSYVNFQIENDRYGTADSAWKEVATRASGMKKNEPITLIWNPDFEAEIMNGGFDWVVNETAGADVFIDDSVHVTGNRSLGVSFNGTQNMDLTFAQQVVRLRPQTKYSLRAYVKTDSLTTNGIFVEVSGYHCSGLDSRSDTVGGTNFWKQVAVDFSTPPDCEAAVLKIRRERSNKLDNKIEGTAWIDALTLKELTGNAAIASTRP